MEMGVNWGAGSGREEGLSEREGRRRKGTMREERFTEIEAPVQSPAR